MSDIKDVTAQEGSEPALLLRDGDERLRRDWVDALSVCVAAGRADAAAELVAPLHFADLGDVIEALPARQRLALIKLLGDRFDYEALTQVDESVWRELFEALPNAEVARGVAGLDSDDAVFLLEDLKSFDREDILAQLPAFERISLKRSLDFPEDSAGRRMQAEFIAIPPFWTVGQTIDYMRAARDLPDDFHQVYVVDPGYKLLGTVPLDRLLRTQRPVRIESFMNAKVIEVKAAEDQEEAARVFERYDLVEVAVVDESQRLAGVLTIDDMVDVIHEEAEEDILALAGVGDEELSDSVWEAMRSRLTWLLVNLAMAIAASVVIGLFDGTIEQMVALAVLMPIVASMGGNAGTQAMTVTVRALATRELDRFNVMRLIGRETLVGVVNGVIFAILVGAVAAIWFGSPALGAVIGVAMVVNMFAAGISGILIPLALNRLGVDPAVASSAFVTTVTDVVGFFAFLWLATLWFGLG